MRRLFLALLAAVSVAAILLARPLRWEVDGLSMAPGLLPGDVVKSGWFPVVDRLWPPRRFERWIVQAPDGTTGIKRLVGLPGERVAIEAGDLSINGVHLLTPPSVLAQVASPVAAAEEQLSDGMIRLSPEGPILDDAAFAPEERRLLLPVRDVGIAAVIDVKPHPASTARVVLAIGDRKAGFSLEAVGRFVLVAGRLDGRFVAAAWRVEAGGISGVAGREVFPAGAPAEWGVVRPWADDASTADAQPALECRIEHDGPPATITVEKLAVWRDLLHRPAADGVTAWRLGPNEVFVLGDFPSGSRDARHWGPIAAAQLLQRVNR